MKLFSAIFLSAFFTIIIFSQTNSLKLLEDSKSLISEGRYGEAIELLNRFVALNPQSAEGFNLRAVCHEKRGNYEQAVYDYRTAVRISPSDKMIFENLKRAEDDWHRLLYNRIEGYKREIAINPEIAKNYLEIGKCYKNLGEWNEAEIWYDLYLEKEEASADEMLRYTEILAKNNHIAKGESYLRTYVEKYPDDHRLWSRYGYFLYWLGKTKSAENAFLKSLEIRPFFKEALDGLDLTRGKKNFYTFNDTTYRFGFKSGVKVYLIDKFYKSLRENPSDDKLRFRLIEELIKYNRIEEALQQLEVLKNKYSSDEKYQKLFDEVISKRNKIIDDEITELQIKISENPDDRKALLRLAELLTYRNRLDEAISYLKNYLANNEDDEIRFQLSKYYLWHSDICESKIQLETLLSRDFKNSEAELLLAKIYLWLDAELDKSEYLFEKYLSKFPEDKEAISDLIQVKLKLKNYRDAESILNEKKSLFTSDELKKIELLIIKQEKLDQSASEYAILEEARKIASEGNLLSAIDKYNQFLKPNSVYADDKIFIQAKTELASLYSAISEFGKADKIYSDILNRNYDLEIDKSRAKNIFWSKDYYSYIQEFKRLTLKYPDDIESKLFLADAYLFSGYKEKAREIYYELLKKYPDSYILNQRLVWIGDKKIFSGFNYSLQLIPSANYFLDNQDFSYAGQSFQIQIPVIKNFAVGGTIHRGNLSSLKEERSLYTVKGMLNLKLNEMTTTKASFGQIFFKNDEKLFTGDFSIEIENQDKFILNASYLRTDASLVLYSPSLVNRRLYTNLGRLSFLVYPGMNFILSARYQIILLADNNQGHQFSFRLGNQIFNNFSAGYEFYYYTFSDRSDLYWSPKNFSSQSVWIEWKLLNTSQSYLNVGTKVGLIPEDKFILSEAFIDFNYSLIKNLSLNIYLSGGSTYRKESGGYRSFSVLTSFYFSL